MNTERSDGPSTAPIATSSKNCKDKVEASIDAAFYKAQLTRNDKNQWVVDVAKADAGEITRRLSDMRTVVGSCEGVKAIHFILDKIKSEEPAFSLNFLLNAFANVPSIYISLGNPVRFRIIEVAEPTDKTVAQVLPSEPQVPNQPNQEAVPESSWSMWLNILVISAFLCSACLACWAVWAYLIVPRLIQRSRMQANKAEKAQVLINEIDEVRRSISHLELRMTQYFKEFNHTFQTKYLELRNMVQSNTAAVPTMSQESVPVNNGITSQNIAAQIANDWIAARANPEKFRRQYSPVEVDIAANAPQEGVLCMYRGDRADAGLWALGTNRKDEWIIVPTPWLNVPELSYSDNRRGREKFHGVFHIERGEFALTAVAIAQRHGNDFYVTQPGSLRLPGV